MGQFAKRTGWSFGTKPNFTAICKSATLLYDSWRQGTGPYQAADPDNISVDPSVFEHACGGPNQRSFIFAYSFRQLQIRCNPDLATQQTTTQVLVADGGTVVIGGVIQTSDTISRQQVPLLGDIPIFGNLFKRKAVSTSTQELIFFITPRIVKS